ncbi:MAG: energy-coupled thiamine transporter ThiT [Lachnospiraceae bacterium]|nr:energy-coupled thiamine transporter ThiT [Lachnospiraceae bacterium]
MEFFKQLYSSRVNDWGETTYYPTTYGIIVLCVAIGILIIAAIAFAKAAARDRGNSNSAGRFNRMQLTVFQLTVCGMSLALGTVLSNLKVFRMPTGGSVTALSMLVISLPGYFFGLGAGIVTGIAYGVLQLVIDPYVLYPMQLVVDYLLAFGAMGLSGLFFKKKNGLIPGYIAAVIGRYIFAVISGWIFFGSYAWEGWDPLPYSAAYNAVYIFAEAAATVVILLLPPVNKALRLLKTELNSRER